MAWIVRVAQRASHEFRQLDASLRTELTEHVAALAEAPSEFLTKPSMRTKTGEYRYSYRSEVALGLVITLYFHGPDDDPPHLDLVAIAHIMESPK